MNKNSALKNLQLNHRIPLVQNACNHFWLVIIFIVILSANLIYHFLLQKVKAIFVADGYFYFVTCGQLITYIKSAINGHLTWAMLSDPNFATNIARDGPVVAGLPAIAMLGLKDTLTRNDWPPFIVLFSIMQSISACIVGTICRRITGARWIGLLAGLLFGLYPTSIIASGLYRSEIITTSLELLFVLCLAFAEENIILSMLAGITGISLWMCKPALIPGIILAIILTIWKSPKYLRTSILMVSIFASIIIPWSSYMRIVHGAPSITVERFGNSNAAMGCDLSTDGWAIYPPTEWQIARNGSPATIITSQWQKYPRQLFMLTIGKITRLFAHPWNEFREIVFGITPANLQLLHTVILYLSIFGIFCYLLNYRKIKDKQVHYLANLSLLFILAHFSYLLFQAIGRYGYTAMPFLFIFVGYGIFFLKEGLKINKLKHGTIAALLLSFLLVAFINEAEAITKIGQNKETFHTANKGMLLEKKIDLSAAKLIPNIDQALILIDANDQIKKAKIIVNGHAIQEPVRLASHFGTEEYHTLKSLREIATLMDVPIDDYRQWRAVSVPVDWLNLHDNNVIDILVFDSSLKLFADAKSSKDMPSLTRFIADYMTNTSDNMDRRATEHQFTELVKQESFIKNHNDSVPQLLTDSLRIKLALIASNKNAITTAKSSTNQTTAILRIDPAIFSPMAQDKSCAGMRTSRYLLKYLGGAFGTMDVPPLIPTSHIEFTITGECRVLHGPGKISITIDAVGPEKQEESLALAPSYIRSGHDWQKFEIKDLLPLDVIGGKLNQVTIGLWPLPRLYAQYGADKTCSEAQFRNIQVQLFAKNFPCLSQDMAQFY